MDLHSGFKDTFKNNPCTDSCPCIQRTLLTLGDKQTKRTSQKWTHFTKKNIQIVNSRRKECLINIIKSSGNTNFSLNKIHKMGGSGAAQSPSHVRLFVTPWTAAKQASLSLTISQSLLFTSSGQSIRASASASVLPTNTQA